MSLDRRRNRSIRWFTPSFCVFLIAGGIGTIVNQWLIGWLVIVGLSGICLFFMTFGLLVLIDRKRIDLSHHARWS